MADPTLPPIQFDKPFGAGMGGARPASQASARKINVLKRERKKKKRGSTKAPLSGAATKSAAETSRFFSGNQLGKPFTGMGKPKTPISGAGARSAAGTSRFFSGNQFGKPFTGTGGPYKAGR